MIKIKNNESFSRYAVHFVILLEREFMPIIHFATVHLPDAKCGCNLSMEANLIILLVNTLRTAK